MPERIVKALGLNVGLSSFSSDYSYDHRDQLRALSRARNEGFLEAIPAIADKAAAALLPVERQPLIDRLTMLGMSMANGKDSDQVRAWLHETARLLADLPQSVLFDAIDECVKEPGRVFVPSVGEIREKASASLRRKESHAARLRRLAMLIEEGMEIPEWQDPATAWASSAPPPPEPVCTPEQAAAILKEYGLPSSYGEKLAGYLQPEPPKSRADMIAEGRMPPPLKTEPPAHSWDGMA
ncbi:MAG: hypothetical protein M3Q19_14510 [Pseudomonadota bacterium]|nr:hypothetical protein [Pseudomonadota bacterium]